MSQVNVHEAKTNLSKLMEAVESGRESEVIIARNGRPAVRIVALSGTAPTQRKQPKFGFAKGTVNFDYEAFQALDVEVQALFDESIERDRGTYR